MKILLKMPPAQRSKAFLYNFEGYVEAILEGRRGERTLNDMKGMSKSDALLRDYLQSSLLI